MFFNIKNKLNNVINTVFHKSEGTENKIRLIVRPAEENEAEKLLTFITTQIVNDDVAEEFADGEYIFNLIDKVKAGGEEFYYIFQEKAKAPIGYISLKADSIGPKEMGIQLLKRYRGLGYGKLAVTVFCDFVQKTLKENTLKVSIKETNEISLALFEGLDAKECETPSEYFSEIEEGYRYFTINCPVKSKK